MRLHVSQPAAGAGYSLPVIEVDASVTEDELVNRVTDAFSL
jgi:hypothetical protein